MTKEEAQKSYDKMILFAHKLENYKTEFSSVVGAKYKTLQKRLKRIIKADFEQRKDPLVKREILSDAKEEIKDFSDWFATYSKAELFALQKVVFDNYKNILESDINEPVWNNGFYNKIAPINDGKVVSVAGMVGASKTLLTRDIENVVLRMSLTDEDEGQITEYFDSFMNNQRNNVFSISETAVALVAGFVLATMFSRDKKVEGHQHISILDGVTSDTCRYRHLKVWYPNDPGRSTLPDGSYPPYHFRCRSVLIPIYGDVGVIESPTYPEWFARQSATTQRDILGATRFGLYREGKYTVEQFIPNGKRIPLSELNIS